MLHEGRLLQYWLGGRGELDGVSSRPLRKPNLSKERAQRKREIAKKDRAFQEAQSQENCEACKRWCGHTTAHHIIRRANKNERWNSENVHNLCHWCHDFVHTQGDKSFYEKFPHLNE